MHLTPAIMEGAYNLLLTTPPFKGWKLPPSDEVVFIVLRTDRHSAAHSKDAKGRHTIRLSHRKHATLASVIATVAHEMAHMRDTSKAHHGAQWHRLADRICKIHGFDRGQF